MGDETKKEGSGFWGGVIKGSYSEPGGGWKNTAGQIVGGLVPGTGIRDATADVKDMWNNGISWGGAASFGINIFSEVPLFGDAAKVLWKGGKAATEVGQAVLKTGDDVLEQGAKQVLGEGTKDAAQEGVEQTAKKATKEGVEEAAEESTEQAVKQGGETATDGGTITKSGESNAGAPGKDADSSAPSSGSADEGATAADVPNEKGLPSGKKPYSDPKSRPSYGEGQVDEVWEKAKQSDGNVYDPNTGELLQWDKTKPRTGQWDMGHMPEGEYRKLHKDYMDGKMSKDEFLRRYRDPKNYRPESPSANRSHKYEAP